MQRIFDGQLPGFSSFMVYTIDTGDTIIICCNLSASPVDGQNASVLPPDPAASPTPAP